MELKDGGSAELKKKVVSLSVINGGRLPGEENSLDLMKRVLEKLYFADRDRFGECAQTIFAKAFAAGIPPSTF